MSSEAKPAEPKTILITGAGVGIGAEVARELASENTLILHFNSSEREVTALRSELDASCTEIELLKADLATESGCCDLHEAVAERHAHLDVLVNNAGGMIERRSVDEFSWDHLASSFALNSISTMRVTALFTPLLQAGSGPCVVNVTSIAMRHGAPTATAYGAAKAAVDSFTRGAATELAPRIRVNAVAPGIIDTRFHERVTSTEKMGQFVEQTPLRRVGQSGDVAQTVRFLVENDFITGETIDCNGGLWMR